MTSREKIQELKDMGLNIDTGTVGSGGPYRGVFILKYKRLEYYFYTLDEMYNWGLMLQENGYLDSIKRYTVDLNDVPGHKV